MLQEAFGLEDDLIWTAASGFGGGIGRLQLVCGALTGAVMALGLAEGRRMESPGPKEVANAVRPEVRQLMNDFEAKFGATGCRVLTGFDFDSPTEYEAFRASADARAGCESYIRFAVEEVVSHWAGS